MSASGTWCQCGGAGVVLASVQGRSASEMMFAADENYVREVIHAFNRAGVRGVGPEMERRPTS